MKKISKSEMLAILAVAGVSTSGGAALAINTDSNADLSSLGTSEHARPTYLADDTSKCGKGSCGKDEKGASAAKQKHGKSKAAKSTGSTNAAGTNAAPKSDNK